MEAGRGYIGLAPLPTLSSGRISCLGLLYRNNVIKIRLKFRRRFGIRYDKTYIARKLRMILFCDDCVRSIVSVHQGGKGEIRCQKKKKKKKSPMRRWQNPGSRKTNKSSSNGNQKKTISGSHTLRLIKNRYSYEYNNSPAFHNISIPCGFSIFNARNRSGEYFPCHILAFDLQTPT